MNKKTPTPTEIQKRRKQMEDDFNAWLRMSIKPIEKKIMTGISNFIVTNTDKLD